MLPRSSAGVQQDQDSNPGCPAQGFSLSSALLDVGQGQRDTENEHHLTWSGEVRDGFLEEVTPQWSIEGGAGGADQAMNKYVQEKGRA